MSKLPDFAKWYGPKFVFDLGEYIACESVPYEEREAAVERYSEAAVNWRDVKEFVDRIFDRNDPREEESAFAALGLMEEAVKYATGNPRMWDGRFDGHTLGTLLARRTATYIGKWMFARGLSRNLDALDLGEITITGK